MTNNSLDLAAIKDKVAVITGGSRGIGKSVADAIIANGGMVVIGDLLEEEGKAVVAEYNKRFVELYYIIFSISIDMFLCMVPRAGKQVAAFISTDVTKYSDNKSLFQLAEKEFGGVDVGLRLDRVNQNTN